MLLDLAGLIFPSEPVVVPLFNGYLFPVRFDGVLRVREYSGVIEPMRYDGFLTWIEEE